MSKQISVWSPRPSCDKVRVLSDSVTVYGLPAIKITTIELNYWQKQIVLASEAVLFVSQHAVKSLLSQLSIQDLKNKHLISIGEKTAKTLKDYGLPVSYTAKLPYNSEILLISKPTDKA